MNIRTHCVGCVYRRPASAMNPRETICHYLLDTGHSRGCPAESCPHWRPSNACNKLLGRIRSTA